MSIILVTGAGGQLGQTFQQLAAHYPQHQWHFPDRSALDITNEAACADYFTRYHPDVCFNTAAYTAVDKAETDYATALAVNATAAKNLALLCAQTGCRLVHFSSDYVYAPHLNRPIREDDPTAENGAYAATKLLGDQWVLDALPTAAILRTSWVYSLYGNNFLKTMLRLGREREQISVVFDQIGTPTYTLDLALAALALSEMPTMPGGIYHFSNEGVCSWYDFARAIFKAANLPCQVVPIESKDYPTPASRPTYSVLNKAKIKATLGISIQHWEDALADCLENQLEYV